MNRLLTRTLSVTTKTLGVRSPGYGPKRLTTGKRTGQVRVSAKNSLAFLKIPSNDLRNELIN